jgi:NADPH:quinone reductase-like Zn-dependent oxidoreductase
MLKTEAWVLHEGPLPTKGDRPQPPRGSEGSFSDDAFRLETFEFDEPTGEDCLVEPLYGSWEGNISHAIARDPVDICRQRRERKVVLGNSGVVRVLRPGPEVKGLREGDVCLLIGTHIKDRYGYMTMAHAYDAPNTMGLLAKRSRWPAAALMPVPRDSGFTLSQWAAFNLRYFTAWSNHRVAYGAWRLHVPEQLFPGPFPVWAWGGGVAFAQLTLAMMKDSARCVLITSSQARRELAARAGLETLDRSAYPDLSFDASRYDTDPEYAARYRDCEKRFVQEVRARTDGEGAAIFIDNIGTPVFRATLKALAREGVVASCGWKLGMRLEILRAMECIARHTFVHTHYASRPEAEDAIRFACERGWMPPQDVIGKIWEWNEVAKLAEGHMTGTIDSYFPVYRINPE